MLASLFLALVLLSVWMQTLLVFEPQPETAPFSESDSDYFMQNVVVNGKDADGNRYRIEARRLVHYPARDGSSLEFPRIFQFDPGGQVRETAADTGWLDNERQIVTLTDNVRIRKGGAGNAGFSATAREMVIHLRNPGANP